MATTKDSQGGMSLPWTCKLLQMLHSGILNNCDTAYGPDEEKSTIPVDDPCGGCVQLPEAPLHDSTYLGNIQPFGTSHPRDGCFQLRNRCMPISKRQGRTVATDCLLFMKIHTAGTQ